MKFDRLHASRRALTCCLAGVAMCASSVVYAQLKLQQFGLGGSQSNSSGLAAGGASAGGVSQLVQNYVGANQQVLGGQSTLASSMGLSSAAGQARQASGLLNGGTPSVSQLTQVGKAQQSVSQSLTQAFSKGGASSKPVDKQAFSSGLASLGQGVSQYSSLRSGLGGQGQLNASSLLQGGTDPQNAQAASYIAKSAPGQLQSLMNTLSLAVKYAQGHGITVPSIASSALQGGM